MNPTPPSLDPPVLTPPAVTPWIAVSGTVAPLAGPCVIHTARSDTSLLDTARALVADDKGVQAIDESRPTGTRRFARGDLATTLLAGINNGTGSPLPWPVAFSFGRAIQQPALTIWGGQDANVARAQQALHQLVTSNRDTRRGTDTLPPGLVDTDEHGVATPAPSQHPARVGGGPS